MPIFRVDSKLIYFAHVPKCAGSSMVKYLQERFGALALNDDRFHFIPEEQRWSKTSPQHINTEALDRMFPKEFFDASFAVVRNPVFRLVSSYHFQIEVERSISAEKPFGAWLEDSAEKREKTPYVFDNHTRPMDEIVPQGAKFFHLEKGFDNLITWLDDLSGNSDGPRSLSNIRPGGNLAKKKAVQIVPTQAELKLISQIYARDFARFGYSLDTISVEDKAPGEKKRSGPVSGLLGKLGWPPSRRT